MVGYFSPRCQKNYQFYRKSNIFINYSNELMLRQIYKIHLLIQRLSTDLSSIRE